jgi:F0F1-type ATP synthase membrane subunit b/b'
MLSKIKTAFGGLLFILAAFFYALSNRLERKKKKVETKLESAERSVTAVEAVRKQEGAVTKAQSKAREENRQAEVERNEKPSNERRTGGFGSASRLRK